MERGSCSSHWVFPPDGGSNKPIWQGPDDVPSFKASESLHQMGVNLQQLISRLNRGVVLGCHAWKMQSVVLVRYGRVGA